MRIVAGLLVTLLVLATTGARAHVTFEATLDTAQEIPAPTGTLAGAGGTAEFEFDDGALSYDVTVQNLTAPPVAGHLHEGAPGVAGGIVVGLPTLPPAAGQAQGSVNLPEANVEDLFSGNLYINFHTPTNPAGEIRGQVRLAAGKCSCTAADFKQCVKAELKKLDADDKKAAATKALKKAAKKASCGKTKGPKKAIACCLPRTPQANIVTDKLCAAVSEAGCTKLGGTSRGTSSSCFPANPCSPSGAFLDF